MARKPTSPVRQGVLAVYAIAYGPRTWRSLKVAVDTGATYTMLPPDLLIDIGYDPPRSERRLELSTASGLVIVPVLRIRLLKCLGFAMKDVEIAAHHLPPEGPVEGLLGLNVLEHFPPFQTFYHAISPFSI